MTIEVGKAPPAFSLPDATGNKVALKDFKGRDVILYFYPKDDTPGCTKEACGFRDAWSTLEKRGVVVIGVSPDKPESHQKFIAKYELPFILLSDEDKAMMISYDAYGEKLMYGKKTQGVIRSTVWVGVDGRVRKHWARIQSAADHPAKVMEALDAGA